MLLGLKTAASKPKKKGGIPGDCYEVEYIETTGTQYAYVLDNTRTDADEFSLDMSMNSSTGRRIFCGGGSSYAQYIEVTTSGQWGTNQQNSGIVCEPGKRALLEVRPDRVLYVDGTAASLVALNLIGPPTSPTNPFTIGRAYGYGSAVCSIRIYGATFSLSGKLVRDLVPVRRVVNGVSVGYLCDRLTGQLYGNAGSGSFVIGPDKYDAEVEYLESTGTQWVETNQPADPRNLPLEIGFSAIDKKYVIGGGPSSSEGFGISVLSSSGTSVSVMFGWNTTLNYWNNERTTPYHITGVTLVDGSYRYRLNARQGNGVTAGTYADTMVLFGRKVGSSVEPSAVRIYYAKVGSRDFIPVRYRGAGYLYDRESGRLFGNQGTGSFAIGEDKRTARDYIQNGLLAMWDATENVGFGQHDAFTPIWYDLTGNGHNFDLTASSVWSFEDTKFVVPDATNVVTRRLEGDYDAMKDGYTFEAVVMVREPDVADYPKTLCGVGDGCLINYYCHKTNDTLLAYYSTSGALNGTGGAAVGGQLSWGSMPRGRPCVITVRWDAESSQTSVFVNGILMRTVAGGGLAGDQYANRVGFGLNSAAGYGSTHGGNNANYGKGPVNGGDYYSFRVYRRVLSDEEVAANFDIDNARFGLVG